MTWLVLGLALWTAAHLFKRVLPAQRAALGNKGKGLVALGVAAGLVLMIVGYRAAPAGEALWAFSTWAWHLNNTLMLLAVFLLGVGKAPGVVRSRLRHPMLLGVVVWAVAHLMVNGDVPSLVLFGGLGLWALVEMAVINRAEGPWQPPAPGSVARDLRVLAISVVLYAIIAAIHGWLGPVAFVLFPV